MRQSAKNVSAMPNEERSAYAVKQLTDALVTLLKERSMREISVSELCDAAGVGRASFYRNFEAKEDILKSCIHRNLSLWACEEAQAGDPPLSAFIRSLFAHFAARRDFYGLLNERRLIFLVKDALLEICGPKPEHSPTEAYAKAFVAYALYGWIELWFQRGMRESPEEMAALFRAQGL